MVKELNSPQELKEFIKKGTSIVDFWAPWCGPCRAMAPIFDEVSHEYKKIAFGKINVEDHGEVSGEYGIQSIPCLIIFVNGKENDRIIGLQTKESFKKKLDTLA